MSNYVATVSAQPIIRVYSASLYLRVTRLGPLTLVWGKIGGGGALESLLYLAVRAAWEVHEALHMYFGQ